MVEQGAESVATLCDAVGVECGPLRRVVRRNAVGQPRLLLGDGDDRVQVGVGKAVGGAVHDVAQPSAAGLFGPDLGKLQGREIRAGGGVREVQRDDVGVVEAMGPEPTHDVDGPSDIPGPVGELQPVDPAAPSAQRKQVRDRRQIGDVVDRSSQASLPRARRSPSVDMSSGQPLSGRRPTRSR